MDSINPADRIRESSPDRALFCPLPPEMRIPLPPHTDLVRGTEDLRRALNAAGRQRGMASITGDNEPCL